MHTSWLEPRYRCAQYLLAGRAREGSAHVLMVSHQRSWGRESETLALATIDSRRSNGALAAPLFSQEQPLPLQQASCAPDASWRLGYAPSLESADLNERPFRQLEEPGARSRIGGRRSFGQQPCQPAALRCTLTLPPI
jgi:hypothetical protein